MSTGKNVHKLAPDSDPGFYLLGIASHENDYRISWAMNQSLDLHFTKAENYNSFNKRINEAQEFSMYVSASDDSPTYKLISNRCENGFLLEELKNIDYILKIDHISIPIAEVISSIRSIPFISTVFLIDLKSLKSKSRL